MKNFAFQSALLALLAVSAGGAAAEKPVIGVILPLDGPGAAMGRAALNEITKKLPAEVATVVQLNDHLDPAQAVENYKTLVVNNKAVLIIGPLSYAGARALPTSDYKVPVLALAQAPTVDALKEAQQRTVFMFNQPVSQLQQLGKALPAGENILLTGPDSYSEKLNAMNKILGSRAMRGQVLTEKNVDEVVKTAGNSKASVVYFGDRYVADEAFRKLRPAGTRAVFMTPPDPRRTASVAAAVALDWIKNGVLSNEALNAALKRSAYFDKDTGSLAMPWPVDAIGKKMLASATTPSSSCTCVSKDGNVNHEVPCKDPPDSCKKEEDQTDCSCECKSK